MNARRASRQRLLQALYQLRVGGGQWDSALERLRLAFPQVPQGRGAPSAALATAEATASGPDGFGPEASEDIAFTDRLAGVIAERLEEIDALLAAASRRWRPDRMAAVDLSVLRLATAELLADTAPVRVVLNEAIELARAYGSEHSPAFVNGVLDGVVRSLDADPKK